MNLQKQFILTIALLLLLFPTYAQRWNVNYDEAAVGPYSLPSLLRTHGGTTVNNVEDWEIFRKPEILASCTHHLYGRVPGELDTMFVTVKEKKGTALNGKAKRKQVTLTLVKGKKELSADLLIYLPVGKKKSAIFLGYNFWGNHTITDDPNVIIPTSWMPINKDLHILTNRADEQSRGSMKRRWPLEQIIGAGYGVVTLYRGDIDPDRDDFSDGIHPLFYSKGQERPCNDEWGTIAAWSWGLSRVMDYLETEAEIDNQKVILVGHSRLGKVTLWTAATDQRFAAAISNNSGAMGSTLSRRNFGETVEVINTAFPHWFCGNFKKYSNREDMLPVDQHMVLSLIAPRPLYIASATEDLWADPKGEFLSAKEASVVYNLYGIQGLSAASMPQPDTPLIDIVSYHIRTGKHDIIAYDWEQYIKFAKQNNIQTSKNNFINNKENNDKD
ncbi:glucuronyl esterase domain-containing protein [Petrimonas mucosa]|uniref:4-O-methyl-glucuronoyl methylesterase n=1 Tax=Petrimonas mucosa TaxID=1642646 RepID=A0A1G4G6D1_9BACT|nr:hypothetical protein [Petrimonas mucosa]SCM57289.1 4-O-methyl-glucuronoyl methylesterase [Petrimonas mucosa]